MKSNIIRVNQRYRGETEKAKFISMINEIKFDISQLRRQIDKLISSIINDMLYLYNGNSDIQHHSPHVNGVVIVDSKSIEFLYKPISSTRNTLKEIEDKIKYYTNKFGG